VSVRHDWGSLGQPTHALPADVRSGDLILVSVEVYDLVPYTVPAGFTAVATVTGGGRFRP
jgi:hypothetical protein